MCNYYIKTNCGFVVLWTIDIEIDTWLVDILLMYRVH